MLASLGIWSATSKQPEACGGRDPEPQVPQRPEATEEEIQTARCAARGRSHDALGRRAGNPGSQDRAQGWVIARGGDPVRGRGRPPQLGLLAARPGSPGPSSSLGAVWRGRPPAGTGDSWISQNLRENLRRPGSPKTSDSGSPRVCFRSALPVLPRPIVTPGTPLLSLL